MAEPQPLDDRAIRAVGIPSFGIAIPHVTGLFGAYGPRDLTYWAGQAWFLALAALIWHANRWLLFTSRRHVDWFGEPLQKVFLLLVGVLFGTVPVTLAMLVAWYRAAGFPTIDWRAIEMVTLTNVLCVVFVTHVYETVFLIKERERDLLRVERSERGRVEAELEALRAQVDPHFLFNSLNTLTHLIAVDPARACAFNTHLARVYRFILSSRGRALVLLSEEMAFVEDYLALLEVRFGAALRVETAPSARPLDRYMVPPVSVQLLVENAIKHNDFSAESPLELRITFEGGRVGVSHARRARRDPAPSAGSGLRNLAERYRLTAAREIEIHTDGAAFTVHLPLLAL